MRHHLKTLAVPIVALVATGCATKVETQALQNIDTFKATEATLVGVKDKLPDMMHNQSSKAAFGMIGAGANIAAGKKLAKGGVITDPSEHVEAKLQAYITSKTKISTGDSLDFSEEKTPKTLPQKEGRYTINASTTIWGLNYFPLNWNSYQTYYSGNVVLADDNGKVLAQTNCDFKYPETAEESPPYDELVSGQGVVMQQNLKIMADKCVEKFKQDALQGL